MAISTFYIQVDLGGNPTTPNMATSYLIHTPWGDTDACDVWEEAVNQAFHVGSKESGRQGMYFKQALTNNVTTTVSGTQSGNKIRNG